jgi:nicotinamide-nucleotide adenylyltransferase
MTSSLVSVGQFISSDDSFRLLSPGSSSPTVTCVLDSSFNPPSVAHFTLARSALSYFESHNRQASLLLLLATTNADKLSSDDDEYNRRVEMMQKFAEELPCEVKIALTKKARFVDKLQLVKEHVPSTEVVFVVGFDTMIRILDAKYYDSPISQALSPLMKGAMFYCLTRAPDTVSKMPNTVGHLQDQLALVDRIRQGSFPGVPPEWADRIIVEHPIDDTTGLSSSLARKLVAQGKDLSHVLTPKVAQYVNDHGLYRD